MKRSRYIWMVCAALLLASQSSANWTDLPDGSTKVKALHPSTAAVAYYDFSDTTDPVPISARACGSVSYWLEPDEDGASTGVTVQPYRCTESTLSTNHCTPIYNDTDGDGIPNALPLDGTTTLRIGREDVRVSWLAFDVTANPNSDDARIVVECH